MTKERDVLIQIKTFKGIKKHLGYIKAHEGRSFTEILEELIEFYYYLLFLLKGPEADFKKEEVRDLLEKFFDVKEMARGLLITEKTK